jgi:hypothetical protein
VGAERRLYLDPAVVDRPDGSLVCHEPREHGVTSP